MPEVFASSRSLVFEVPTQRNRVTDDVEQRLGVFYSRPPKCGSSTVIAYFKQRSTIDGFLHVRRNAQKNRGGIHANIGSRQVVNAISEARNQSRNFIVSGHSYFVSKAMLPTNTLLMTVVRHPVLRKMSEYTYFGPRWRQDNKGQWGNCCSNNMTYSHCVTSAPSRCDEDILGLGHTYVKYFCGYEEVCIDRPGSAEAYNKAVRNLEQYDIIGLTELLDDFLIALTRRLPFLTFDSWDPPTTMKVSNTGNALSKKALQKVIEFNVNSTEVALYRRILKRYDELQSRAFKKAYRNVDEDAVDLLFSMAH